ncbi:MAG: hypothetical protein NT069_01430, partial [Planctomycetota bacterium]|nr:hypothetical protein [Planctomycetota bacterium]
FEALTYLEGSGGRFSVAIAMPCVLLFGRLTGDRFGKWQLGILVGLAVAAIGTGAILIVGLLATAWGATLLVPSNSAGRLPLASWMTAAWLAGLSLATPFYTPYPRLTLPWLVVSWLAAGAFVAQKPIAHAGGRSLRSHQFILGGLTLLLGGLFLSARVQTPIDGKIPSVGMREAAHEVAEVIRGDLELPAGGSLDQAVVYIYGEPALLFQLRLAGVSCHPIQDLGFASGRGPIPAATYVVIGERTTREPHFADQREVADRLRLVQEVIARLPPLVWLDEPWDRPISSESSSQHPYRFEILRLGDRRTPDSLP